MEGKPEFGPFEACMVGLMSRYLDRAQPSIYFQAFVSEGEWKLARLQDDDDDAASRPPFLSAKHWKHHDQAFALRPILQRRRSKVEGDSLLFFFP